MENKNTSRVVIGVLVVLVLLLGGYIAVSGGKSAATANGASEAAALPMETYQAQYVKPETPIDRSKNVTLPGWGGFTIPAKTKKITQGFEFHNPAENLWYEDWVSLDGTTLEKLVVDSGQTTELSHYLRLAGIQAEVTKVLDADPAYFEIQKTDAGAYTIEAVKGYKGEKTLTVQTDDGKQYTLTLTGKEECYYIAFGLYLEDGDELLFVHDGAGHFYCDFGHLEYRDGDYLVIPRGTAWRIEASTPSYFLLIENSDGAPARAVAWIE